MYEKNVLLVKAFFRNKWVRLVLVVIMVLFGFVCSVGVEALTPEQARMFSNNDIIFYDPSSKSCLDASLGVSLSAGTGDLSAIMGAKNADKSVFNVENGNEWFASWSDNGTDAIKRVLDHYGDLAYQTGKVTGAPWVAIIVQMRYEDPYSRCGANNFWGNGCDPSHAYQGGATRQGSNLGEGFVQYAQTLTNGYHDQALGITDPKEFLTALGPTWVQGHIGAPGYGSIEGMKKSIDALEAFIKTDEGQAIVSQFGNYSGAGDSQCRCTSTLSSAEWEDGWLVEGSLPGIKKEDVNSETLSEEVNPVGSYITSDSRPNKILLHSTEGRQNGFAAYPTGNKYPAHFTIDLKKKEGYQHFSIYQPALAIVDYDRGGPIQIEIVGFSDTSSRGYNSDYDLKNFTEEEWGYLAKVLLAISNETGIPLTSSVDWGDGDNRMNDASEFINYSGVLGHMHAPNNTHNDPGDIWSMLESALNNSGGYDGACTSSAAGNGDINATAIELAWPVAGVHDKFDPSPAYKKALEATGMMDRNDAPAVKLGASCDVFVATVMRYSGADSDFYCCGVTSGNVQNYLNTSGKYEEIPLSLDTLEPGDILVTKKGCQAYGHIELYVEVGGEPKIASASHDDRTAEISSFYQHNNCYTAYRLKR